MLSNADMTRRLLLRGVAAFGLAAVAMPRFAVASTRSDRRPELRVAVNLVRTAVSNHRGAARLGAAYLRTAPGEADLEKLVCALTSDNPDLVGSIEARDHEARDRVRSGVRRQIVADFERDAVVTLDGWILSRTEVRLAALAHMVRDRLPIA